MVVSNLLLHGSELETELPLLRKALNNTNDRVRSLATQALCKRGSMLSNEQAQTFEHLVKQQPDDLCLHVLLLGYYFERSSLSESKAISRRRHILWVIANAPESESAGLPQASAFDAEDYGQAKDVWLKQVELRGESTAVLANAAGFLLLKDRDLSERLLKKGQSLEPNNQEWSKRLAHLYSLTARGHSGRAARDAAARSLEELEKALAMTSHPAERFDLLLDLAKSALEVGDFEKARTCASELLTKAVLPEFAWHSGDAVHHGNLVLGRLALMAGNIEQAKAHLIEAGKTRGSPVLQSFGPKMMLAKELLERGERGIVVQYLRLCTNFWQTANHQLEQWIYVIERGEMPDFAYNLRG
jgi:tetratricopeptide (TPR) repeat protein